MAKFGQLITDCIPHLRRYAYALVRDKHRADDLVQDCLMRAWSKQHLWNAELSMRPWLFTILHNLYVNDVQKGSRSPQFIPLDEINNQPDSEKHENQLLIRDFSKALNLLDDRHKEVLLLVGMEQLSYKETAEILDIPMGTVMSRLSRAREQLFQIMNRQTHSRFRRVK